MFEIFPWNQHLETGIALVDEQHHKLVALINRLAQQHVQGATEADIQAILAELADYAHYHFESEESIWEKGLSGNMWLDKHLEAHQQFFDHVVALQQGQKPFQAVLDDLFAFLTQWLAWHILDNDKRMALALAGVHEGLSLEAAHQRADVQMRGATGVLIQSVLTMYQTVSAQALELMHEKLARQRAEQALLSNQQGWRFLLRGDTGQTAATSSPLEQTLRTIIDNVPTGLVVADAQTRRFVFANAWFCRMLGYSLDELLGMSPMEIHPPEALPQVEADFQRMMADEQKTALAIPVRRKDGSTFIVNIERVPVALSGQTSVLAIFTDITERHRFETALKASEVQLHTLVDTIPDLIWLKDVNGVYLSCNPAFERFFGAPEAAIVGKTDFDFVPQGLAESFRAHDRAAMAAQRPLVNEEWITYPDNGQHALLETTKAPMRDSDGQLLGILGISHDITLRRGAIAALETERLRLLNAIDAAQAGTWEWDIAANLIRFSERTSAMLGYPGLKLHEGPYALYISWIHPEDQPRQKSTMTRHLNGELHSFEQELRMRHKDGHWVWVRTLGRVMQRAADGKPLTVAGISIDISEQKTHREQIDYITLHDALTGLPNRKLFVAQLAHAMAELGPQRHLAVAYLDLDNFAAINQAHGLEVGNQLILEVSRKLATALQGKQMLAHIGGDEFALMFTHLAHPDDYLAPVNQLLQVVAQPLKVLSLALQVTASVGVTLFAPGDKMDAEQLLRQADQAMYLAKQAGKNRYHAFDPVTDETTRERLTRIDEVRQALDNNEMVLHYQPKVRLKTGEVIGFEALIRWQHPQRGLLPPHAFIGLLEQHPMAITLGDWVITTALAQLAQWQTQGLETSVSVNIDAMQLLDPDFADRLQTQLSAQPSVAPNQLELEILETGALGNMAHVSALIAQLQNMGLECSLDDFGTGYSSLTFLKQLAAHTLKIDQSFVRGMLDDAEHATIVNSVLGLARNFERRALAEGVETEAHGQALIEFGCELGQGYAIARPMPAANVPGWLAQWRTPQSWIDSQTVGPRGIPVLLAEVEHRAWFKQVQAYATQPTQQLPPNNSLTCRFGHWLNKPATRMRLQHLSGFAHLEALHEALHERTGTLLAKLAASQPTDVPTDLAALAALSQNMLTELRQLRSVQSDTEGVNSAFADL
ncbi:bacteriohemerythrin [Rhodoferax sp. 4810]|nr:bacteriohemerythrin [Rhodoferax jenense]